MIFSENRFPLSGSYASAPNGALAELRSAPYPSGPKQQSRREEYREDPIAVPPEGIARRSPPNVSGHPAPREPWGRRMAADRNRQADRTCSRRRQHGRDGT